MLRWISLWYLCFIFSSRVVSVSVGSNYTTIGYDRNKESAIVTECRTPNGDMGFCIEIKECSKLAKQLGKNNTNDFLLASRCGSPKDYGVHTKVCCGKYDNFIGRVKKNKIFPESCGRQEMVMEKRIVGGQEASLGEFPWLVRLLYKTRDGQRVFGCSGSLIHYKFVLTAAHCIHPGYIGDKKVDDIATSPSPQIIWFIRSISVVLGEHNTETDPDCSVDGKICNRKHTRKVIKVINHPGYNPQNSGHYSDIAILQLRKAVRKPNHVRPICILRKDNKVPTKYYVSGWGKTEKELYSKVKTKVDLPAFDLAKCKEKYSSMNVVIKDTQICVGGEKGKDTCVGDSGGPLMMVSEDETWYLSGIVSFGMMDCGTPGFPGVYTNITQFLPWIKSEIQLNLIPSNGTKQEKKSQPSQPNVKSPAAPLPSTGLVDAQPNIFLVIGIIGIDIFILNQYLLHFYTMIDLY